MCLDGELEARFHERFDTFLDLVYRHVSSQPIDAAEVEALVEQILTETVADWMGPATPCPAARVLAHARTVTRQQAAREERRHARTR